jgi:hypothetical protein
VEWRGGWFSDEVDEARGLYGAAERGFVRLDAESSEAQGGKATEAEEKLLECIGQLVTTGMSHRRDGGGGGREWV